MAAPREVMYSAPTDPSYVDRRLQELGLERRGPMDESVSPPQKPRPRHMPGTERPARKAKRLDDGTVCGADGLRWRPQDLALIEQLVTEERNVLLCGTGGTGKSTLAAVLAVRYAAARTGKQMHCVLEHYPAKVLEGATGITRDQGGFELRAALRRGALPACQGLVFDEIYTSTGAHSLLAAWRAGLTGIGTLVVSEPAQGDCLGRLALLEQAHPDGFAQDEVVHIYRSARPVIVRAMYPGLIESWQAGLPLPPWMANDASASLETR